MQIGLIGGIGPAAQDYYLRTLIALFAEVGQPLDLTTAHADTLTLIANLGADDRAAQAAIFAPLTEHWRRPARASSRSPRSRAISAAANSPNCPCCRSST